MMKGTCDCCRSPDVELTVYRNTASRPALDLCPICYNTMLGVYAGYPEQHDTDMLELMKLVAYIGNLLLKKQ